MKTIFVREKGLSLVELLVAMVLSLVIIAGIIQVFLSNRQAFNLTESRISVQESGRFALNYISQAIRDSGNYGCVPTLDTSVGNIQSHTAKVTDIKTIQTIDSTTSPVWHSTSDGAVVAGAFDAPDSLALFQLDASVSVINAVTAIPPSLTTLSISGSNIFKKGDFVLVSNCEVADLIELAVDSSATQIVDTDSGLRHSIFGRENTRSTVSKIKHLMFSITDENLIVEDNGVSQEVVSGIENIQFQYGVDIDGDSVPDYYDDFKNIPPAQINNITAIKVSVLAVSGSAVQGLSENITTAKQSISFNGKTVPMLDNRLRSVFRSTVVLRNRMN